MEEVDEGLLRDFEVHALFGPRSLLVVLLQPLVIDISDLSPL